MTTLFVAATSRVALIKTENIVLVARGSDLKCKFLVTFIAGAQFVGRACKLAIPPVACARFCI